MILTQGQRLPCVSAMAMVTGPRRCQQIQSRQRLIKKPPTYRGEITPRKVHLEGYFWRVITPFQTSRGPSPRWGGNFFVENIMPNVIEVWYLTALFSCNKNISWEDNFVNFTNDLSPVKTCFCVWFSWRLQKSSVSPSCLLVNFDIFPDTERALHPKLTQDFLEPGYSNCIQPCWFAS